MGYLFCLAGSMGELTAGLAIALVVVVITVAGAGLILDLEMKVEDFRFAGDEGGILLEQRLNG